MPFSDTRDNNGLPARTSDADGTSGEPGEDLAVRTPLCALGGVAALAAAGDDGVVSDFAFLSAAPPLLVSGDVDELDDANSNDDEDASSEPSSTNS